MPGFFDTLWSTPDGPAPMLARYTIVNGVLYLAIGGTFYLFPGVLQLLPGTVPYQGIEEGLARALGMTLAIVGWFYVMGGRTHAASFGLATVADRALVPLLLAPLIASGDLPASVGGAFAVLDPLLALGALWTWRTYDRPTSTGA